VREGEAAGECGAERNPGAPAVFVIIGNSDSSRKWQWAEQV
jgi:hypothetical protein